MTVVRRGNSFGVKVWDSGRGRYRWVGTFPTEAEALQAQAETGTAVRSVADWCRIWLSEYARPSGATRRSYGYSVRRIVRELGARDLASITRPEARRIANTWPDFTRRVAVTVWSDAVREGVCELNPWSNMRFPKSKGRKNLTAL